MSLSQEQIEPWADFWSENMPDIYKPEQRAEVQLAWNAGWLACRKHQLNEINARIEELNASPS